MNLSRLTAFVLLLAASAAGYATMTETVGNRGIGEFLGDFRFAGEHYHLGCRDDEVLVGVYGREGGWIDRIGIRCVEVDPRGRWEGDVRSGSSVGGMGGEVFAPADCPRHSAVVGFRGKQGSYVDKLKLECRPLVDAGHVNGPSSLIGPFGGEGGSEFDPISCNAGRAATGIYGRAGSYVDKLGLKCAHERIWMPDYHYFPQLDAGNESTWMNDPSGLIFQDGVYHLYYQAANSPRRFDPGRVHWDHASSRDLLIWTDHPRVFSPVSGFDPERGGSPFTGSAVGVSRDDAAAAGSPGRNERCIVALFTRAVPAVRQRQNRAASCDGGRSFSPDVHALSAPSPEVHYRDPKVFRFADSDDPQASHWVMVLAVGEFIELYKADDLAGDWERTDRLRVFTGAFASTANPFVETADLLRVPVEGEPDADAWVLTFAQGAIPLGTNDDWFGALTQDAPTPSFFLTGRFDGRRFLADGAPGGAARAEFDHIDIARRLDAGPDFYALQSWHIDGTTSADFATRPPIAAAWVSNWNYALFLPTYRWQGQLSIPRTLRLQRMRQGLRLVQEPVAAAELLRNRNPPPGWRLQNLRIDGSGHVVDLGSEKSYELLLDVDTGGADRISVDFNHGPHPGSITLHWQRAGRTAGRLHLDRARSFPLQQVPSGFVYPASLNSTAVELVGNRLQLRVLVDRNSVEVFPERSEAPLTALFYPHPDNRGLRVSAGGGRARIVSATIFDLDRSNVFLNRRALDPRAGARPAVRRQPIEAPVRLAPRRAPTEPAPAATPVEPAPAKARTEPAPARAPVQRAPVKTPVRPAAPRAPAPDVKSLQRAVDAYLAAQSKRNPRIRQRALWDVKARPAYNRVRNGTQVETDVLSGRSRVRMRFLVSARGQVVSAGAVTPARKARR